MPDHPLAMRPKILLFRGASPISALIRWQTRGRYAHAALRLSDGRIVESYEGAGVRVRPWPEGPAETLGIEEFDVAGMTDEQWRMAQHFALSQVGRGYDWWAIVRFVSRRWMPANDRWFCSELVFASLEFAGVRLLERVESWAVSPAMLAMSPRLVPPTEGSR